MPRRLTVFVLLFGLSSLSGEPIPRAAPLPGVLEPAATAATQPSDPDLVTVLSFFEHRRTGLLESELEELAPVLVMESRRVGLAPEITLALIGVESSGYNFAVSPAGALGLMQLRPTTAKAVAQRIGLDWRGPATLFDPVANVRLGVSYLASLVHRFGDLPTALAAYNWGPTRIAERIRLGEPIPAQYTRRVLTAYAASLAAAQRV